MSAQCNGSNYIFSFRLGRLEIVVGSYGTSSLNPPAAKSATPPPQPITTKKYATSHINDSGMSRLLLYAYYFAMLNKTTIIRTLITT